MWLFSIRANQHICVNLREDLTGVHAHRDVMEVRDGINEIVFKREE